jgi:hypothetical protein
LCSIGVVTTAVRPSARRTRQAPSTAMLSASVPPDVKHTSSGAGPEGGAEPLARLVERRAGLAPPAVQARRVAEARPVERIHRRAHFRAHRRGRGVVQVDGVGARHGCGI